MGAYMRRILTAATWAFLWSGAGLATTIIIGPDHGKSVFSPYVQNSTSFLYTLPVAGKGSAFTVDLNFQAYPDGRSCRFNCDQLGAPITGTLQFDDGPMGAPHYYIFPIHGDAYNATLTFSSTSGANIVVDLPNSFTPLPEPTTWAMMVGGFGVLGSVVRRRTRYGFA